MKLNMEELNPGSTAQELYLETKHQAYYNHFLLAVDFCDNNFQIEQTMKTAWECWQITLGFASLISIRPGNICLTVGW